jgi:Glycosyltransferases involved in cell wall biogenesis
MQSETNERVSVIIPTRNRPQFLEECIQSVLAQTISVHEIIIVNDGSDAKYLGALEQIATIRKEIHLYNLPANHGRSYSRNFGLDHATGDYILFLDDDDLLDPQMMATSLPHFRDPNIDVVTCLCKVLYPPPEFRRKSPYVSYLLDCTHKEANLSEMNSLENAPFSCIWRSCPPIHSSLIRKSALEKIRFPEDLTVGEDWYLWLSLASANRRFKCNRQAWAYVRRHDSNTIARPGWLSGERMQFLQKMVCSGMIQSRKDVAILNLRLFLSLAATNSLESLKHLSTVLKSPLLLIGFALNYVAKKMRPHAPLSKNQIERDHWLQFRERMPEGGLKEIAQ